jgi:hypothetical protein
MYVASPHQCSPGENAYAFRAPCCLLARRAGIEGCVVERRAGYLPTGRRYLPAGAAGALASLLSLVPVTFHDWVHSAAPLT